METTVALETDFIRLLTRLISESDDSEPPIERAGRDLICTEPSLGRWFDSCDMIFLFETLALPDTVFQEEFPEIKLSPRDREAFAKILDMHSAECAHCNAKRAEDIEWKKRIDKAFVYNKQAIAQFLVGARSKW